MSRRARIALVAIGVLLFVMLSGLLARVLSVSSAERSAMLALARAQARGDERAVLRRVSGCAPGSACRRRLPHVLARVRRSGTVKILRFDGPGGLAITGRSGKGRLVWKAGQALPVVQCFRLLTEGDPLQGYRVRVASIEEPIGLEASC